MSRAKELTDAHWDNYVGPLLTAAGVDEKVVALCGFIYKSSGIHFYKHAVEDANESARAAYEQSRVDAARGAFANSAAHKAPSLCDSEKKQAVIPPFTFPAAFKWLGKTETEYDEKLIEEVDEVVKAEDNRHRMIELFDVIHVCESAIRTLADKTGVDPAEAAAATVCKNEIRGYYKR